jgi:hypothetical protein
MAEKARAKARERTTRILLDVIRPDGYTCPSSSFGMRAALPT